MMKKSRKTGLIILISAVILLFGGCQLAQEGAQSKEADRLVGAVITLNHINEETSEEKFYATPSEEEKKFIFDGIDGFPMYAAVMHIEDENETYRTSVGDESIEASTHLQFGDNERIEMEGTIRFAPGNGQHVFWVNPVYQEDNGRVYAQAGQGFALEGATIGDSGSQTLEEELSFTSDGRTQTYSSFIKVNFVSMLSPEKISVLEMDENSNVRSRKEYEPGKLPDNLRTSEGAEYMVIETEKTENDGESLTEREIINKSDEMFATYYERDDGILIKVITTLDWR